MGSMDVCDDDNGFRRPVKLALELSWGTTTAYTVG